MNRRVLAGLTTSALAMGAIALTTGPSIAAEFDQTRLSAHDRELLSKAQADGKKNVVVMVVADRHHATGIAQQLAKLGGKVHKRVDSL